MFAAAEVLTIWLPLIFEPICPAVQSLAPNPLRLGQASALSNIWRQADYRNLRRSSGCCGGDFRLLGKVLLSRHQHDGRKRQNKHRGDKVVHCRCSILGPTEQIRSGQSSAFDVGQGRRRSRLNSVAAGADTNADAGSLETNTSAPVFVVTPALDITLTRRVGV